MILTGSTMKPTFLIGIKITKIIILHHKRCKGWESSQLRHILMTRLFQRNQVGSATGICRNWATALNYIKPMRDDQGLWRNKYFIHSSTDLTFSGLLTFWIGKFGSQQTYMCHSWQVAPPKLAMTQKHWPRQSTH